jgi:3',5'-cyclic AMP phosphodiesterase CpdA
MDTDKRPALSGNPLRFAHLSDLHLPHEPGLRLSERFSKRQLSVWSWQRRRRTVQSPAVLEALRGEMSSYRPDRILVTGDITNFSLPAEFASAAQWLDGLPAPVSIVPGNHDALVPVSNEQGWGHLQRWSTATQWPYVQRHGMASLIGLRSAVPTAPLLASGRLGTAQRERLARVLGEERTAGQIRILMLHHPVADGAVSSRKALRDRRELRAVLREQGADLVLHGHARNARLDALPGPFGPIPCLCVPSSTALPNEHDEAARWHLLELPRVTGGWARVLVRQWTVGDGAAAGGFTDAAHYELRLGCVK